MQARIDTETRRRMIAEAAYFRAEQRGFAGGDPLADWIAAEAEVDAALRGRGLDELGKVGEQGKLADQRDPGDQRALGAQSEPRDHGELLARIDDRVAEAAKKVEALRRRAGTAASEVRAEVQQEIARIAELREALEARAVEIRQQGSKASRSVLEQADSLWKELTEFLARKTPALRRSSARRK